MLASDQFCACFLRKPYDKVVDGPPLDAMGLGNNTNWQAD
jgi:hypothetical protein